MTRRTLLAVPAALLCAALAPAQEKDRPRPATTTGEVAKVDATSLTVTQRGDSGVKSTTFALDAKTKIVLETAEDETVKGEGGERTVTRPKAKDGTAADLKAGQRVTVTHDADKKAAEVVVRRPAKKESGKEGK
ncbi:MAG: hypothetical protein C0501_15590 [Isosphaera sp.]|nr:hypothetical protein [Isosphaera sp.]